MCLRSRRLRAVAVLATSLALLAFCVPAASAARPVRVHQRVIGGTTVQPGSWPSVAYVASGTAAGRYRTCTGTLVAPTVVLTAAHCATEDDGTPSPPSSFAVATGMVSQDDLSQARAAGVTAVHVHPAFDRAALRADVALLMLDSASPAPVMRPGTAADEAPGARAAVAGWGVTSAGAPASSTTLQTAATTIQPDSACSSAFAGFDAGAMLCAADTPAAAAGTCNGDSGGPIAAMRADGSWVQIGITSWGAKGCDARIPSVFVRMSAVAGWIADRIAGNPTGPAPGGSTVGGPSQTAPAQPPARVGGRRSGAGGERAPLRYSGRTEQGRRIVLRLGDDGHALVAVSAAYRSRCGSGPRTLRARAARSARRAGRRLASVDAAGSFAASGTAATAARYRVTGTLVRPGRLAGTLRIRDRVDGERCDSGPLRYVAVSR